MLSFRHHIVWALPLLAIAILAQPSNAIEVAENLLVDLSADHPTAGSGLWTNTASGGAAVGNFAGSGTIGLTTFGAKATVAVEFSGDDFYRSAMNAPGGLVGINPSRTIEVWTVNPAPFEAEETVVSWGHRGGPEGSNMAFNYGDNGSFGAVGHWGAGPDMGWGGGGAPAAGQWQHLVYVHDDVTGDTRVYANGLLKNVESHGGATLNTHGGTDILVGAQHDGGNGVDGAFNYTGAIAQVRVHDGALTSEQVTSNFAEEAARFFDVEAAPTPNHRYSFTSDVNDSIAGANGVLVNGTGSAMFSGGALQLNNAAAQPSGGVGNYVDLPTGIVAGQDAVTLEFWGTFANEPATAWSRVFDFGNKVPAGDLGEQYIFLTPKSGPGDTRLGIATPAADQPGFTGETDIIVGGLPLNSGEQVHVAAVFDDNADTMRLFINGLLFSEMANDRDMADIDFMLAWLGRSLYNGDHYLQGSFDEFRVYHEALTNEQVLGSFLAGPNSIGQGVPEPATGLLGLLGVAALGRRRRRAA